MGILDSVNAANNGLERMLDYRSVGLERFHCIAKE